MINLEKRALDSFYFLSFEMFKEIKQLSIYFGNAFDSAFNCVIYAPFSRKYSKKQHEIYLNNRKKFRKILNKYFFNH